MRKVLFLFCCILICATKSTAQFSDQQGNHLTLRAFDNNSQTVLEKGRLSDSEALLYIREAQRLGKSRSQISSELVSKGFTLEKARSLMVRPEVSWADSLGNRLRSNGYVENAPDLGSFPSKNGKEIFGHRIFNNAALNFEPAVNIATPTDYKLGPGDEVIIDVWGENQLSVRNTISPDGSIFVSGIGPLQLAGLTVEDANKKLQRDFSRIYSGIEGSNSEFNLTLGQIRTIQINVMGEVIAPGTYTLSSFATLFYALYRSGGINDIGTLRNIYVMRNNKKVAEADIYEYILNGSTSDFIKLYDGDVVIVPTYDNLVYINGKIKRPMYYEIKTGETLADVINYSGGFTGDAYSQNVRLTRYTGLEREIFNIDEKDFSQFLLMDGDSIEVGAALERYTNRIEIEGAVFRPGSYELNESTNSVFKLISKAEGLREDAFLNRVLLTRKRSDLTLETVQVDLNGIIQGIVADMPLKHDDILYIPSISDLKEDKLVTVHGAVARPGRYIYAENTTLEDIIIESGGLLESASTVKIDVARRIKNPKSQSESNKVSNTYTFSIKDGFILDGPVDFVLEPFDEVYVRESPTYHKQRNVSVTGEILFAGNYALTNKNERLTDLIKKAGGLTSDAYIRGARIERRMNADERKMLETAQKMAMRGGRDSVAIETIDTSYTYNVGIELDKALDFPGSEFDMVLREGDRLIIPEYVSTVKINGAVLHSNTVLYQPNKSITYYINQGGGYASNAKRNKIYIVYLNGTVSRYRSKKSIEPGCEIFVPSKAEKRRMSPGEIMGIATSATSLATMGVAISNAVK